MARGIFTLTHLTPEQEQLIREAEDTLGGHVLLAYSDQQVQPATLNESQVECLQGLEQKLGMTILAVEHD